MIVVMLTTFMLHIAISTAVSGASIDGQLRQKLSLSFIHQSHYFTLQLLLPWSDSGPLGIPNMPGFR